MGDRWGKSLDALFRQYELPLLVLRREFGITDDDRKGWQKLALILAIKYQPRKLRLSSVDRLAYVLAASPPLALSRPRGRPRARKPGTLQPRRAAGRPREWPPELAYETLAAVESIKTKLKNQGKRATDKGAAQQMARDMGMNERQARRFAEKMSRTTLPYFRRIIKRSKPADSR